MSGDKVEVIIRINGGEARFILPYNAKYLYKVTIGDLILEGLGDLARDTYTGED